MRWWFRERRFFAVTFFVLDWLGVFVQNGFKVGRGDEARDKGAVFKNNGRCAADAEFLRNGVLFTNNFAAIAARVGQRLVSLGEEQGTQAVGCAPHLCHAEGSAAVRAAARVGEIVDGDAALGVFEDVLLHQAAVGAVHVGKNGDVVRRRIRQDADHGFWVKGGEGFNPLAGAEGFGDIDLGLQIDHFTLHDVAAIGTDVEDFVTLSELVEAGDGGFDGIAHDARVEDGFGQFHIG